MNHPTAYPLAENVELATVSSRKKGIGRSGKTPLAAIRNRCLDCCCWQAAEVRECPATDCALHPYRFGKRPTTIRRTAGVP